MNKSIIAIIIAIGLLSISGCSSTNRFSSETSVDPNAFQSYESAVAAYKALEAQIDDPAQIVTQQMVRDAGFSPSEMGNHEVVIDRITFGGNEPAANLNIKPDPRAVECARKGKTCTAFLPEVIVKKREEIPEGEYGKVKSIANLEKTYYSTYWKFGAFVVFDGDRAVYISLAKNNIDPQVTKEHKKQSIWKHIGRALIPDLG